MEQYNTFYEDGFPEQPDNEHEEKYPVIDPATREKMRLERKKMVRSQYGWDRYHP